MRLDRHNNKCGELLILIKDAIHIADNTAVLTQSADYHLEQQGISITMPYRQQFHIHNIYIPPRSRHRAGNNASIAHLFGNNEMSLIVEDINAHHFRWDTNTNKVGRGEQLADEIGTADSIILKENEATRLPTNSRSTSPISAWPPMTSHYNLTDQFSAHWPAIICPSSSISNFPRLMGLGEPT